MSYSVDRVAKVNFGKDEIVHIMTVMALTVIELPSKTIPTYTSATLDEIFELMKFFKKKLDDQIDTDFQLSELDLVVLLRSSGSISINGLVNKYSAISGQNQNDINRFVNKVKVVMDDHGYSL